MRIVDGQTMQAADALAVQRLGATELMRRAGLGIATVLREQCRGGSIVAFAGPGNNGGDAFAACAELADEISCTVYTSDPQAPSAARSDAEARARAANVTIAQFPPHDKLDAVLTGATCILDGILGIGGRNDTSSFAEVIAAMNRSGVPVYALDVPTGVDATTGEPSMPIAVRASHTLMIGAPKIGLFLESAHDYTGELSLVHIGITESDIDAAQPAESLRYHALTRTEFIAALPQRAHEADKRSSGAPLIIAGSQQFPGAAILCSRAAARAGAGYVTVATPSSAAATLRAHLVEQVVVSINEIEVAQSIDELLDLTRHVQAVGIGPGLGLGTDISSVVRAFIERSTLPMVIDASGFAHIAKDLELLRNRKCVLTPHASEFARLSGKGTIAPGTRIARLREFVDRTGITTMLKGNVTLIYDGHDLHINTSGTSALATAGTGDVLTGIIATLLAQGCSPIDAARIGAYWHGCAGQLASQYRHIGVVAGDLPELLAKAALPNVQI